jgi:hypothetical protein
MTNPNPNLLLAVLTANAAKPSGAPTFAGQAAVQQAGPAQGNLQAPAQLTPGVPIYNADATATGQQFLLGTPVVLSISNGGNYYISGAPGYVGLTPAAVAAQVGFGSF